MEKKYRRLLTFTGVRKRAKRQIERRPVEVEVIELNGHPVTNTYLLDMNIQGARLEASIPLSRNYRVSLSFMLPGLETPIQAFGRVMWVQPLAKSPGRFQMGLKFDNPIWELQQLIYKGEI